MEETSSFIEFIDHICKRPSMYTEGSVKETLAFIDGYRFGNSTPISSKSFDRYVCIRNSFPTNYVWTYVIQTCASDDHNAFELIQKIIVEFVRLKENMSENEIIDFVASQVKKEEGKAEKMFREFDKALLAGKKELIEPLIEKHKDASILWKGSYPTDVANKLNEISSDQPIKCIPISVDGNRVNIIAQGWPFPIEMNFVHGEWKINAEKIIELRNKSR